MKQGLRNALAAAAVAVLASHSQAAVVTLTWVTTTAPGTSIPGSSVGETYTTTIRVDNGGSSILSQSWDEGDFLSFRQEGSSGWWIESTEINLGFSSGAFSTDATGAVVTAGNWQDSFPTGTLMTSWAGAQLGGWWNNGRNETSCLAGATVCVWAENVASNIVGRSWTAALEATAVPAPASLALVGLALVAGGMAGRRRG